MKIFFQTAVANYQCFSEKHHKQITKSVYINQWLWSDPVGIYFLVQYLNMSSDTEISPLSNENKQPCYLALVLRANSSVEGSEWQYVRTLPAQ